MELRPYQAEAKAAIYKEWEDKDKTLLVLPTGCGKTIVFASIAEERTTVGRVLILAHREELLTQASDKIRTNYGVDCAVEKAEQTSVDSNALITVGSVQTLMTEKRLSRFTHDYFKTVIIDEAHHAMAKGYQNILTYFDSAKVLGVTATPDRGDMKELSETFESLAYEYSLRDAVKQGYLSPIKVQTVPLNIDLSSVKVSCGDFQVNDIGHALEPYLEDIAEEMRKICMNKHTVVFLPLVAISQAFRDILNRKGFRAAEVNGESKNRDVILQEFEQGKYNVLCNSMLLTEGWDCPIVDCIVVLRPTKVRSLYCQMIGRGTRLFPGKDHLLVLDFLWMTGKHNLVHPADIICKKKEIADRVTLDLEDGDEKDLFAAEEEAEKNVLEERKNALQKALEEAENQRKEKKLVDPLELELSLGDDSLIDYVPTFGWEAEPATQKQLEYLEKMQIAADSEMCRGKASKLIDRLSTRRNLGLCTPRQAKALSKYGFANTYDWKFEEASAMMSRLAAAGWKKYKLNIVPEEYIPPSLLRDENLWN
ncbi:MAG: DEAD/DEAH box helicase family protein [Clostridiales bacterium]|nr:DEAD/DEAH box helicase family protein [Clostridiales bacterium]